MKTTGREKPGSLLGVSTLVRESRFDGAASVGVSLGRGRVGMCEVAATRCGKSASVALFQTNNPDSRWRVSCPRDRRPQRRGGNERRGDFLKAFAAALQGDGMSRAIGGAKQAVTAQCVVAVG